MEPRVERSREIFDLLRYQIETGDLVVDDRCCWCPNRRRPGQRTCVECNTRYVREWRRRNGGRKAMTAEERKKQNARARARYARDRGRLVPLPCEAPGCTSTDVSMHHHDYDRPLDVTWLCRSHHQEYDARVRARR